MNTDFSELFEKNNWKPIDYNGRVVSIGDDLIFPAGVVHIRVEFESTKSDWEQGIFLKGNGLFLINDQQLKVPVYFWESTCKQPENFIFESKDGILSIWNIWRINQGPMQYGHNGSALYFDDIPGGKRYYCNDGYPDDDFDDLIFTITINAIS